MLDLKGKKGLVIGVANQQSIAWGCARRFHRAGAELILTCKNEKAKAYVTPLATEIGAPLLTLDVQDEAQMDTVFQTCEDTWGRLDFVVHSIAFAPKADLHGRVTDASASGFALAMEISCRSFLNLAKRAEPLMRPHGGSLLTTSFYGSHRVVPNYSLMGPVKAALESCVIYLAQELGPTNIRVNALSPGPIATRAASGIRAFDTMLDSALKHAPKPYDLTIDHVGAYAQFLVSDAASPITGNVLLIDNGLHLVSA